MGYFHRDDPWAGHDEIHRRLVFFPFQLSIGNVVHRRHSRHGRHVIVDQDLRLRKGLAPGVLYFNFDIIVPERRRIPVHPDLGLVLTGFFSQFVAFRPDRGGRQDKKQNGQKTKGSSGLHQTLNGDQIIATGPF